MNLAGGTFWSVWQIWRHFPTALFSAAELLQTADKTFTSWAQKKRSNKHLFEIIMIKRKAHITQHKHFLLTVSTFSLAVLKMNPIEVLQCPPHALLLSYVPNPPLPFHFESKLPRLVLKSGTQAGLDLITPSSRPASASPVSGTTGLH